MKKTIKYKDLIKILSERYGTERNKIFKSIKVAWQIRHFSPELKEAFYDYFENEKIPTVSYSGVTFQILRDEEDMDDLRAFLMLDWISKNPHEALDYMASGRFRSPMEFSGEDLTIIKSKLNSSIINADTIENQDESDIIIEESTDSPSPNDSEPNSQTLTK